MGYYVQINKIKEDGNTVIYSFCPNSIDDEIGQILINKADASTNVIETKVCKDFTVFSSAALWKLSQYISKGEYPETVMYACG